MADQRPAFRFRLPWLPAAPAPRPAVPPRPPAQPTATTTPTLTTPQTAAPQAPPQPSSTTNPPPTMPQTAETQVPSQPSTTTTSAPNTQTAERAALTQPIITTTPTPTTTPQTPETQNPMQPTAATTTSIPTAERPSFRPPGVAPAQVPPQSQTSRTESQPSSPSRTTTQPRVPSQPASPSRAVTQSPAPSQPPSTPPRAAPQPGAVSLPSSPSRRSPQLPSTTQTATQPRSPSLLASTPAGQTPSPTPPSSTIAQQQPTAEAVIQPTSPQKTDPSLTEKSSQSSANSTEVVSLLSDKQEPKSAPSESLFPELQPRTAITAGTVYDSQDRPPIETSVQPNEMTEQASKESEMRAAKVFTTTEGPQTPAVTQISNTSTIKGKPESSPRELKPEETKEVKEVVQDTKDKACDRARYKDTDLTGDEEQTLQTKDLPSIPLQSEQAQKTIARKQMIATSPSNGKQTKITTAHPKYKTTVVDTRQKLGNSKREYIPLHKEIRDDNSKLVNKMAVGDSKHSVDNRPVSVITLAGENKGASMHVGSHSSWKEGAIHIRRGYKTKPDDSAEATTDGEESFGEQSNNPKTKDQASEAYVNSNVQVINNSILFNSSITERNPGVHLIRSHFTTESKKPSGKSELVETQKAEFNMTPPQKLTHEPTVRRRCLRGLFLESSDSDLNTTKPRRHGCRVGCNGKSKENKN